MCLKEKKVVFVFPLNEVEVCGLIAQSMMQRWGWHYPVNNYAFFRISTATFQESKDCKILNINLLHIKNSIKKPSRQTA